jgi:GT2 family glycosyltransferase
MKSFRGSEKLPGRLLQNNGPPMTAMQSLSPSPLISLILVTMNRKEWAEDCLRSLETQTYRQAEIIVVDNASTDGTAARVQALFPGVRCFKLERNRGVAGARNYGVQKAHGEICVFLDDDAVLAGRDALEKVMAYFRSDSRLAGIAFKIVRPGNGREEYKSIPRADKKSIHEDYECSYFCGAGFAVRRSTFLETGMFWDPLFFIGEELDFGYRLLRRGYKILRVSCVSVIHAETPQARVPGKWIYYGTRSRFLVAVRNLPWMHVLSQILLWWGYFLIHAVWSRNLLYFFKGMKDALRDLPQALHTRERLDKETLLKLKKLSGRIYY